MAPADAERFFSDQFERMADEYRMIAFEVSLLFARLLRTDCRDRPRTAIGDHCEKRVRVARSGMLQVDFLITTFQSTPQWSQDVSAGSM